ncbi:MAG TPA: hypothetical protein VFZ22_02565 [Pyrinomonadaceae bacterium]|nr:hypothetical protein [Pyrinomonadaceae bacterium]
MNKEVKNEIDLLLRQLGRREEAVIFEAGEPHLDADELNSYVANALPQAARARYTAHLADCSVCRKMVAQLSAAQGPVAVEQAQSVPAPSFLKQFLASLFSPMVLRYAVPALGVIVVMVVGFIVMRRDRTADIAGNVATPAQRPSITAEASPSPEPTAQRGLSGNQGQVYDSVTVTEAKPSADARTDTPSPAAPVQQPPAPAPQGQAISNEAPPPPKAVAQSEDDAERRAQRETPATIDAAKSTPATNTNRQVDDLKKEPATGVATATGSAVNRSETRRPSKLGEFQTAAPAGAGATRARDEEAKKDESAKANKEAAEETRSVNGRQFRKSGDVWIDTAYSSQRVVNVKRGSEQYRALVADEPELRSFAEQIDGEFIVVWKSRAYRFR